MTAVLAAVLSAALLAGCVRIPAKSDNKENTGGAVQSEKDGSENLSGGQAAVTAVNVESGEEAAETALNIESGEEKAEEER